MDLTPLEYFKYDELASFVWNSKYRMGDEKTPQDMFERHISEIAKKEYERIVDITQEKFDLLSKKGKERYLSLLGIDDFSRKETLVVYTHICQNLRKWLNFDNIVLGGSMLQGIGNHKLYSSLSNCFVVGQPYDSYSGINKKENEITQLMKRRGGAGIDLSTIRPYKAVIHNQATFSSGPVLFADGYSNKTKQVAQLGRRGALMISLHLKHPDSKEFIMSKQDESKITGANISVKIPDDFMEAVIHDTDYTLCFPVDFDIQQIPTEIIENAVYDELFDMQFGNETIYLKKIHARDLWQTIIDCAHSRAEPGILFIGNWEKYGPDYVYQQYRPISTNPCSEIPMQPYDACRLLSGNLYKLVKNRFMSNATIPAEDIYNLFYEQQIIADLLVDLELDYIDRICAKIASGNDPQELKDDEIAIWTKVKNTALAGRRCGSGFTALGDCLAALGMQYGRVDMIDLIFQIKLEAELDATVDMAVLYGAFDGYDAKLEEKSEFIQMIKQKYPVQYKRMVKYGRRNVSWSTGAPTGTLSIMTQTTSGVEPLFKFSYKRRKKCITPDERVDYIDPADKQKFTEYFVVHPQFIEWFHVTSNDKNRSFLESKTYLENCKEAELNEIFKKSPWYGNEANDIPWEQRIAVQSTVQKYTSHAISSTINLPNDVQKEVVGNIYMESWKAGLKGNTVYRDGCRGGVLVSNTEENGTVQIPEPKKRPRIIPGHYYTLMYRNKKYSIIIGLKNDKPYEIFIVSGLTNLPQILDDNARIEGEIVKDSTDWYNFEYDTFVIREISDMENDEKMLSLMLSGLMRFDAPLSYITKILEKTKPIAGSFTHRLIKILSNYYTEEEVMNEPCPNCGASLTHENGCVSCKVCGWSKC